MAEEMPGFGSETNESPFGQVVPENPIPQPAADAPAIDKVNYHEQEANKAMRQHIYELSTSWSRGREYKKPFDYIIESSQQRVKVRRLDMGDLLQLGVAEEMDFMTKGLMSSDKKETGAAAVSTAMMSGGNFDKMQSMVNKVVLAGLLQPKVHHPPMKPVQDSETNELKLVVDDEAKNADTLYVDEIPFQDRMELFAVIFESDGIATFRSEQTADVGDVENVSDVPLPSD